MTKTARLSLFILSICITTNAHATPINLNDFFADSTVTVAADGSSATLAEDPGFAFVLLANDPGLGDPEVILAGDGVTLSFDYDFVEGSVDNDDAFEAFVLDSTGVSAGAAFEFFSLDTSSGTVSFDLSGLVSEPFIGLQFQLSALAADAAFDSTVTISNAQLTSAPGPSAIPEPSTLLLLGVGIFGCAGVGWGRRMGAQLARRIWRR